MKRTKMKDPNNDIIDVAATLRTVADRLRRAEVIDLDTVDDDYNATVIELSDTINDVIFNALKEGRLSDDILRALNEVGNILVSRTQDYDEFKE